MTQETVKGGRGDLILSILGELEAKSFLEIGVAEGDVHRRINLENKVGVDPFEVCCPTVLKMTSDEFFQQNEDRFDVIFIDGDHSFEQSRKDFYNSVEALNNYGVILMHDIDQLDAPEARGEVYLTWQEIEQDQRFETHKIYISQDRDYIGMVKIKPRD